MKIIIDLPEEYSNEEYLENIIEILFTDARVRFLETKMDATALCEDKDMRRAIYKSCDYRLQLLKVALDNLKIEK